MFFYTYKKEGKNMSYEKLKRELFAVMLQWEESGFFLERMILRPFNYLCNLEELGDGIYWKFGDIALALHTLLYESREEYVTMKITRGMLDGFCWSDKGLLAGALNATCAAMPPRLYRCKNGRAGVPFYRLTNARDIDGAVTIFYPGVQEWLAGIFGGDYYAGFAGTHEVLLCPVRNKVLGEMREMVLQANVLCDEREMLTTRVYRYCREQQRMVEV
jgi:hypothetical protein